MGKVKPLTVGEQVIFIFGLICLLLVGIGLFLFFSLRDIERHNRELQTQIIQEWKLSNDLSRNLSLEQVDVFRHIEVNDGAETKLLDQSISHLQEEEAERWNDYARLVDNPTETQL
jgi:hypothetical protein